MTEQELAEQVEDVLGGYVCRSCGDELQLAAAFKDRSPEKLCVSCWLGRHAADVMDNLITRAM